MDNWGFINAVTGDEITVGWRGYDDQARDQAQTLANDRGCPVEMYRMSDPDECWTFEPQSP